MAGHVHQDFQRISPPLEGQLVRLRAVEDDDLPRINQMFWDPPVSQHIALAWPEPLAGTRAWWGGARANDETQIFAIESFTFELLGVCSLEGIDARARSATLGIWVGTPFWNKGYGTDAVRTLCRFGFKEMNLQRIGLSVYSTNPRAVRAYEKAGFKEEGRRRRGHFVGGRFVDVITLGLLAEELIEP